MTLPFHTPLSRDQMRAAGVPDDWPFAIADKVRFSEIDALGHVNHTDYLRWCESARLPYLADRGISLYGPDDPRLVLHSVTARYHSEMYRGEAYVVAARTTSFRRTSFRMEYGIYSNGLRAECSAVIVLLTQDGKGRIALTDAMKSSLIQKDGARPED